MATISSFGAATSASGVGYACMSLKKMGIACLPWVRLRKVTATRRRKGSCASRSWMRPNVELKREGKGIQEMIPAGDRGGLAGDGCGNFSPSFNSAPGPNFDVALFFGVTGPFLDGAGEMGGVK